MLEPLDVTSWMLPSHQEVAAAEDFRRTKASAWERMDRHNHSKSHGSALAEVLRLAPGEAPEAEVENLLRRLATVLTVDSAGLL